MSILISNFSQNCIDALILKLNPNTDIYDTVYCKILNETEKEVIIDNGYSITSLSLQVVVDKIKCVREMTVFEIYKFKGLDEVTFDLFTNSNTSGAHLRKAAFNIYLSIGLGFTGATVLTLAVFVFKNQNLKTVSYIGGGLITASSIFFIVRGWNHIYKAGKLLDLTENSAIYLTTTKDGLGLSLKF
jgi:hypothetical protein